MTDEQINAAIAHAIKWPGNIICRDFNGNLWPSVVPNYCNDLNAMHEAESTMDDQQYNLFSDHLHDAERQRQKQTQKWRWLSATARQRAEAFLRTLGKWEEVQP